MIYFDTSFLAPLVLAEATSGDVESFMRGIDADVGAISHWTDVEFASALGRRVRMNRISPEDAAQASIRFRSLTEAFDLILPIADDFDLARRYLGNAGLGLRAGDALHLAVAANRRTERILTLDMGMLAAGTTLGLPVETGITLG